MLGVLKLLRRDNDRFRFTLHAYALMPNHGHLILEPASGSTISKIMQSLTIAYTRWFHPGMGPPHALLRFAKQRGWGSTIAIDELDTCSRVVFTAG